MNLRGSENRVLAMTLIEAVVVICVIGFVVLLLLPALRVSQTKHHPIMCYNNLNQLATAMKVWEGDNNDKYPMGVSVTNGGTKELMDSPDAWRAFQVLSNEIVAPWILRCPQDFTRTNFTRGFGDDLKNSISYFIGIIPDDSDPQSLLSGDDNFRLVDSPVSRGNLSLSSNNVTGWDISRHVGQTKQGVSKEPGTGFGYLMMADGSVCGANDFGFKDSVQRNYLGASSRVAIP